VLVRPAAQAHSVKISQSAVPGKSEVSALTGHLLHEVETVLCTDVTGDDGRADQVNGFPGSDSL
jgi:hypothetical protein